MSVTSSKKGSPSTITRSEQITTNTNPPSAKSSSSKSGMSVTSSKKGSPSTITRSEQITTNTNPPSTKSSSSKSGMSVTSSKKGSLSAKSSSSKSGMKSSSIQSGTTQTKSSQSKGSNSSSVDMKAASTRSSSSDKRSSSQQSFPSMSSVSGDTKTSNEGQFTKDISPDRKKKQQKRKKGSISPEEARKRLRMKSTSPQSDQTYANQNNDMDELFGGDTMLDYMNTEMNDDNQSTLTNLNYQKDILDEAGLYDMNVDIDTMLREDETFEANNEFKTFIQNNDPITFTDIELLYTYLYMKEDGLKAEKSQRRKEINLENDLSKIKSVFKSMKITNWGMLYVTPTKYIHDFINDPNSPKSKKDLFSNISTFPLKCQLLKNDLNTLSEELKAKINPILFELHEKIPKESILAYKKWSGIYMRIYNEDAMSRVERSAYYDWDSIMENMPQLIKEKDPKMTKLQSWRDLLIITLYKEYPARDDFGFLKLIKDSSKEDYSNISNYFLLDKQTFHIGDFKKHKRSPLELKKPIVHKVSNETMNIINDYLEMFRKKNKQYPEYLITKDDGSLYATRGFLSSMILSLFHRYTNCYYLNIGVDQLRHAKVAKHKDDGIRAKQQLAYIMRHSMSIHEQYSRESKHKLKVPCGYRLDSQVTKQSIPNDQQQCSLQDFYKTNSLPEDCVGRYVIVKKTDTMAVGKILKSKKIVFEKGFREKALLLQNVSFNSLKLLPKGYTPLRYLMIGKVVKKDNYTLRIEQNLDEKTQLEFPYVITYVTEDDVLKQHLVYNVKDILQL